MRHGAPHHGARSSGASPPLSSARERHLLAATGAGDRAATEELVIAFLPAIDGVARLYRRFDNLEREELQQEGVVGLLRAARRYDQSYGTPFWAYASWWVRQAMQQLVAELTAPVVLSDRAARSLVQVKRVRSAYVQANRREPSDSELAESARMPLEQVQHLISIERAPSSLQAGPPGDEETPTALVERLADPATEEDYERIIDLVGGEGIQGLAVALGKRERRIVFAHYGIDCRQRTLREIGEEFELSVERVRQLEERALEKLRQTAVRPPRSRHGCSRAY
ncbi:MAG TPA: sigma-70 family RNA polymerase sigma factor [Solirubrobacterales bacterium]|nr:sigma-70 family RNA polymerase sigma factor [Solirubrobacterales bacterium]